MGKVGQANVVSISALDGTTFWDRFKQGILFTNVQSSTRVFEWKAWSLYGVTLWYTELQVNGGRVLCNWKKQLYQYQRINVVGKNRAWDPTKDIPGKLCPDAKFAGKCSCRALDSWMKRKTKKFGEKNVTGMPVLWFKRGFSCQGRKKKTKVTLWMQMREKARTSYECEAILSMLGFTRGGSLGTAAVQRERIQWSLKIVGCKTFGAWCGVR